MGEVVRFPGNFVSNEIAEHQAERRSAMQAFSIEGGGPEDRQAVNEVAKRVASLLEQHGISGETMQIRRELVKDLDPIEASRILLASGEQDWIKSPTYYLALIERSRHLTST